MAIRNTFKHQGLRTSWIVIHRFFTLVWRRLFGPKCFQFRGKIYRYFHHPFTLMVERTVEIPIVLEFFKKYSHKDVLEVGNVLYHYFPIQHDVVDKYEKSPNVINEDIVTYDPPKRYDFVGAISTLEHVGWDEQPREKDKFLKAMTNLKRLLKDSGLLVATMPLGYNPFLDQLIQEQQTGFSEVYFLKRISRNNQWEEATLDEAKNARFGSPYPCANAIAIGLYRKS